MSSSVSARSMERPLNLWCHPAIISRNRLPDESDRADNDTPISEEICATLFFTVGHATRPIDAFLDFAEASRSSDGGDVRSVPRSRTNPQFNREFLTASLGVVGIEYQHVPELGGLRNKQKDVPVAVNAFWQNQSFHNYADYAMDREFHSGLRKLRALSDAKRCVIMCGGAVTGGSFPII
jgi:Domain of unknown function DUF488